MSSTNKTANLELNQWVGTDPFCMEDFNADNLAIDTAIGSISTSLASKAAASTVSALQTTVNGKADKSTVTALQTAVAGKADSDTVSALQTAVAGKADSDTVSALQTAVNGKQATVTGAATTVVSNNLTASRALISNSNGKISISGVSSTQLNYLNGVTSSVQTQLNTKARIQTGTYTGTNTFGSANKNTLSFDFTPFAVLIFDANGTAMLVAHGATSAYQIGANASYLKNTVAWSGSSVTWYCADTSSGNASAQLNANHSYYWIALG